MNNDKEENENVFEIGNEHIDKKLPETTPGSYFFKDDDGYIYGYTITREEEKSSISFEEVVSKQSLFELCNFYLENKWDEEELKSRLRTI